MAPGTITMIALSTNSMVVMERVSDAKANPNTVHHYRRSQVGIITDRE